MTVEISRSCTPLESTVHGVVCFDEAITDCNERFCRILERDRAELVGRSLLEFCPEVQSDGAFSRERWQRRWQAARAGLPQWFPWQFRNSAGRRVHALIHLTGLDAATGGMVVHVHDLSNLGYAGWIKPDSRARLQKILDRTKAVILVKDRAGRYVFANRELERACRMPAERMIGHTDRELWPPDVAEIFCQHDDEVLLRKSACEFEVTANVGRQRKTFLAFKFPLFGADGTPYALCGIASDITDSKHTQDALTTAALAVSSAQGVSVFQELVRYLATILEVDAALIATPHDIEGPCRMRIHALYLDGEIQENFEYPLANTPCETVVGHSFRIYPSGLQQEFPNDQDLPKFGMDSYAGFPLHDSNGAALGLIAVMSRTPMAKGEFVESILKIFAMRAAAEIERQHADETLRRSEASYRAIFEASEDAIFIHDWDTGAVIDVNRRASEVYGYTYEEMKGINIAQLSSGEQSYTVFEAAKRLEQAKSGKPVRMEWHRKNKDGTLHWDEVVVRPAVIAGQRRVLAFTREITERKQAEQALRQAQKMEALGHLTGGIAHDFNNLLTSIMGYIVLAGDQAATGGDARLAKYLQQAELSCKRARDLIQQMLTFSRGQRGQPRPVSLPPLVCESVKLFGSSLPSTLHIMTELDSDVPAAMLDPVHIDQILLNLCLNARDAMNGIGNIHVSVLHQPHAEHVCTACRSAAAGNFVELRIADDGPGIPAEILDRIFEPFFTTKAVGKGSGMGLASVHGIVHEMGGHIVVDTAPGQGTCFRVLIPALSGDGAEEVLDSAAIARASLPQLSGRVLVVDDEQSVGAFMHDLLERWGLSITVCTNAADAAALVKTNPRSFDLVITDYMMPQMTGIQLATELKLVRPELPIILYTGLNDGIVRSAIDLAGLRAVITKPIDPHELFGLLQTHLPHATAIAS